MTDHDDDFARRARAALDRQADALDGHARSRLTQARHAALDALEDKPRFRALRFAPAFALVLVAVAAVGLLRPQAAVDPAPVPAAAESIADMELLALDTELELLADLEFYLWLEAELPESDAG
ncbi:MAG: hypothetical protein AAGE01_12060 [Pseudomonadota bacterium]